MINTAINTYREVTTGTDFQPEELILLGILLPGRLSRAKQAFKLRPDELELVRHVKILKIITENREQMGNYKPDKYQEALGEYIKGEIPNLAQRFARAVKSAIVD